MTRLVAGRTAFGQPGAEPHWTRSDKDGIGTAYSASSRIWFTLAGPIISEVYYPTIDRPQLKDLEFLVSDGRTFFHEEKRDMAFAVEEMDAAALGYRVTLTAPDGAYRLVKEIIADPAHSAILVHARLEADEDVRKKLHLYVLAAPHLEVGGRGNDADAAEVAGRTILTAHKGSTWLALGANRPFLRTSCGFVGASDGWTDVAENFAMDWEFTDASDGNVALTGEVDLSEGEFTLALSFGDTLHKATTTLLQTLALPFEERRDRFLAQWQRATRNLMPAPPEAGDGGRLYRLSHSLLLAHEDKSYPGAVIASLSIPWGEAKGDEELGGYHLVWTRDMVQSATGLLALGHSENPLRSLLYLASAQRPDGGFHQNFWISGEPYWQGVQLDEVAFPIILAWRLREAEALGGFDPLPMALAAAGYLIREGPVTAQERWEENSGYSPSTLAATIAGLICAASFARASGDGATAAFIEEYADFLEAHIERWTVTTEGTLLSGIPRHYIRILPVDPRDPSPPENPNEGMLPVRNRPPGAPSLFPAKNVVDAGFLELVRYGIRDPHDPLMEDSLRVVDATLRVETPFGPLFRRYNHDGYGQRPDGGAYVGWGQGRGWPLLVGERGMYELAAGRDPTPYIRAMEAFASSMGLLPEQSWDEADMPEKALLFGRPTGSAAPLLWAHAEYVKLVRSAADGRVLDRIPEVSQRYLGKKASPDLEVWSFSRQVRTMDAARRLRVIAPVPFRLRATEDAWQSILDEESQTTTLGVHFVDLRPGQGTAEVAFTFYWPEAGRWEGQNFAVAVVPGR